MRKHHQGSVFQRATGPEQGRWIASVSTPSGRRSKVARTKEDAEAFLAAMKRETPRHHLQITGSRSSFADLIVRHLDWAADEGWGRHKTAEIMAVSLSAARIKFGICGPCVYCGTPYAGTVDHVLAQSRGGTDDPDNLVSACFTCNVSKGAATVGDFLLARKSRARDARSAARAALVADEEVA